MKAGAVLLMGGGGLLILLGLAAVFTYIWAAIIVPWGEPDQSLLFWYLVFPLLGLMLLKAGILMAVTGYREWKVSGTE